MFKGQFDDFLPQHSGQIKLLRARSKNQQTPGRAAREALALYSNASMAPVFLQTYSNATFYYGACNGSVKSRRPFAVSRCL